jgi:DNA polymerase
MSIDRDTLLREMGLGPVWRLREPNGGVPQGLPAVAGDTALAQPIAPVAASSVLAESPAIFKPAAMTSPESPTSILGWDDLPAAVRDCRACSLCETRKQAVLGVGDRQADWLFVGEGPGAEEDQRGEPFVGQAGKLLDNMLAAIGLRRGEDVYIANTVKCRPPNNRTPEPEETAACFGFLKRQIELIQPRLIVALGKPAAQTLLNAEVKVGAARGRLHAYGEIPVIVTYHPAYLLRNLTDKALAWEDLVFMRRTMKQLKDGT